MFLPATHFVPYEIFDKQIMRMTLSVDNTSGAPSL